MFAVFASDPSQRAKVRSLLPPDPPASATGNWGRFQLLLPEAGCSCAVIRRLSRSWMRRLAESDRTMDVLVTAWDPENARRLKDLDVAEVVWLQALDRELPVAGRRAAARARLSTAAGVLDRLGRFDPTLQRALRCAMTDPHPPVTVTDLARRVGWDRRTLAVHWRRAVGKDGIRLTEVVQWIVLLRAVERKVEGRSWRSVARSLDVTERTLFRLARRLTGAPMGDVADAGAPRLRAWVGSILDGALDPGGASRPRGPGRIVGRRDTLSLAPPGNPGP